MLPTQPTYVEPVALTDAELADVEIIDGEIVDVSDGEQLTAEQAQALTQHIRAATDVLWTLVARAHAGRAWQALGYPSWESYVSAEFNMSRSRSYQLLDHARVVSAIEAAAPVGTAVHINERAARELKAHLDEVTDTVAAATVDMSPQQAQDTINDVLAEFRASLAAKETTQDQEGATPWGSPSDDYYAVTGHASDSGTILDDLSPPVPAAGADSSTDPAAMEATRRMFQKVFELYSALDSLSSMPEAPDVIRAIPPERLEQVNTDLPKAVAWLQWFQQEWSAAPQLRAAS